MKPETKISRNSLKNLFTIGELPVSIQWHILRYLSMEDLINLKNADVSISNTIIAHICSCRTVGFTISALVVPNRTLYRRFLPNFLTNLRTFQSRNRHILKCCCSFKYDVTRLEDSANGWKKLWKNEIFAQLKPYGNLRRLGLMGHGSEGGGILLSFKTLRALSEALPMLETLSLSSCVIKHPGSKYFPPIGVFKHSAHFDERENGKILKMLPVFEKLKTLRIDQTELDFLVRPLVFPNLERIFLFLACDGYFPGCILSRYSDWPDSKLVFFTYAAKSRTGLKFFPDQQTLGNGTKIDTFDREKLIRFLQSHQNSLEVFFWQPFPSELAIEVFEFVLKMKELKRLGICENEALETLTPNKILKKIQIQMQKPVQCSDRQILVPEKMLCRNLEYLFLGADAVPDFAVKTLILQNSWTLKSAKFCGCNSLTDDTYQVLAHCKRLETLSFACLPNLSAKTFEEILKQRGSTMKILAVQKCPQLTEYIVKTATKNYCSNLKQF